MDKLGNYTYYKAVTFCKNVSDQIYSFTDTWKVIRSYHPPLNMEAADISMFWENHNDFTE